MPENKRPSLDELLGPAGSGGATERPSLAEIFDKQKQDATDLDLLTKDPGTLSSMDRQEQMAAQMGLSQWSPSQLRTGRIGEAAAIPTMGLLAAGAASGLVNARAVPEGLEAFLPEGVSAELPSVLSRAMAQGGGLVKKYGIPATAAYGAYKGLRGLVGH